MNVGILILIFLFLMNRVNNNQEKNLTQILLILQILTFQDLVIFRFHKKTTTCMQYTILLNIWIEHWWFSPTYTKISSVRAFFTLFHFCKNIFAISDYSSFVGLVLRHADEISLRSTYFLSGPKLALIYAHQRPTKVLLIFQSKKLWYKKSLQNCIFCKGYQVSTPPFRNNRFVLD